MSWAESEKLNEWILRAYENGRREEQERIIKLLEENLDYDKYEGIGIGNRIAKITDLIALIKEELTECECDPCGNENCTCQGKRCGFCKSQAD